mmetsp:Transcript_39869/g.89958  ORF Transcript_39869/g.89958 Transcript_39869/m.89958 type:complete len:206 (-) Transcript_39869:90-707(-)
MLQPKLPIPARELLAGGGEGLLQGRQGCVAEEVLAGLLQGRQALLFAKLPQLLDLVTQPVVLGIQPRVLASDGVAQAVLVERCSIDLRDSGGWCRCGRLCLRGGRRPLQMRGHPDIWVLRLFTDDVLHHLPDDVHQPPPLEVGARRALGRGLLLQPAAVHGGGVDAAHVGSLPDEQLQGHGRNVVSRLEDYRVGLLHVRKDIDPG